MRKEDWSSITRDRRIEIIAAGRTDGLSYLQIAKTRFCGATKSAVIGLANRAGIMAGGGHAIPVRHPVRTIKPKSSNLPVNIKKATPSKLPPAPRHFDLVAARKPDDTAMEDVAVIAFPAYQADPDAPITLLTAGPNQCRWPLWGPDEHDQTKHLICGKRCNGPYCDEHKARSMAPKKMGENNG